MTIEAIMIEAFDTQVIMNKEEEIRQIFVQFAMPKIKNKVEIENKALFKYVEIIKKYQMK